MTNQDEGSESAVHTDVLEQPCFMPNLVISEESLVVDRNGKCWWVRPHTMAIVPADQKMVFLPADQK